MGRFNIKIGGNIINFCIILISRFLLLVIELVQQISLPVGVLLIVSSIIVSFVYKNIHKRKGYSPLFGFCYGGFCSFVGLAIVCLKNNSANPTSDRITIFIECFTITIGMQISTFFLQGWFDQLIHLIYPCS